MQLEIHPLSMFWPWMPEDDYRAFEADIRKRGVVDAVTTYDENGVTYILDGKHRYRVALEHAIECPLEPYLGDDPQGFVVGRNGRRNHIAALTRQKILHTIYTDWQKPGRPPKEEAAEKPPNDQVVLQVTTTTTDGDMSGHSDSAATPPAPAPAPTPPEPRTRQDFADLGGTSVATVDQARQELREERDQAEKDQPQDKPDDGAKTPRRTERREKRPSLQSRYDDTVNMLAATRKENTQHKRRIKDLERQVKAMMDDARPDAAARIQEMQGVQRENESLHGQVQHWQQKFTEEQRRSSFYLRVLRDNDIDPSA